jgi:AcrR family transcriptional regulator
MARTYRLKRRAERQNETRQRIVEAAVALHTTLGPNRSSIVAIAERAGVERPTVYRHFPTPEALFTACSTHYRMQNPPPDPKPWLQIPDPKARLGRGLGQLYAHYAAQEKALWPILRDLEDQPELRRYMEVDIKHLHGAIDVLMDAWPAREAARLRTALGHATDFFAWRSLRRQGLSNDEAAAFMIDFVMATIR